MDEKNKPAPRVTVVTDVEPKPNALKRFVANHPRAVKIITATAVVALIGGGVAALKSRQDEANSTETDGSEDSYTLDPSTLTGTES